jgi:dTDP-4-dehydrorhamnose reductase
VALAVGDEVVACSRTSDPPGGLVCKLDICDRAQVSLMFERTGPGAVIHTAYRQSGERAWETNVGGSRNVAVAAHATGARMVHISTDLVFDGHSERAYSEEDEARPLIPYGEAKLAAERVVLSAHPRALVVRPSLFYGGARLTPHEQLAVAAAAGEGDAVFFSDELRSPTPVPDLARALVEFARADLTGILHLAGPEPLDRFSLARAVVTHAGGDAGALCSGLASELAPERPRHVVLDSGRAEALLGFRLRTPNEVLGLSSAKEER